jgi:hypothetical protein
MGAWLMSWFISADEFNRQMSSIHAQLDRIEKKIGALQKPELTSDQQKMLNAIFDEAVATRLKIQSAMPKDSAEGKL